MKKVQLTALVLFIFITGCAKKEDNQTANVGEIVATEDTKIIAVSEAETRKGEEIDKEELQKFIADSFFYNEKEIDFATYVDEEEIYHIEVLSAKSYPMSDLLNLDSVFEKDMDNIKEIAEYVKNRKYPEDEIAIIETEYEITNIGSQDKQMSYRQPLTIYMRMPDERGTEYGLSDKRVEFALAYTELWVRCVDAGQKKISVNANELTISAGETVNLKCVYLVLEKYVKEELYLALYWKNDGEYSKELKCNLPTNNKLTKFLRLPIEEGQG